MCVSPWGAPTLLSAKWRADWLPHYTALPASNLRLAAAGRPSVAPPAGVALSRVFFTSLSPILPYTRYSFLLITTLFWWFSLSIVFKEVCPFLPLESWDFKKLASLCPANHVHHFDHPSGCTSLSLVPMEDELQGLDRENHLPQLTKQPGAGAPFFITVPDRSVRRTVHARVKPHPTPHPRLPGTRVREEGSKGGHCLVS